MKQLYLPFPRVHPSRQYPPGRVPLLVDPTLPREVIEYWRTVLPMPPGRSVLPGIERVDETLLPKAPPRTLRRPEKKSLAVWEMDPPTDMAEEISLQGVLFPEISRHRQVVGTGLTGEPIVWPPKVIPPRPHRGGRTPGAARSTQELIDVMPLVIPALRKMKPEDALKAWTDMEHPPYRPDLWPEGRLLKVFHEAREFGLERNRPEIFAIGDRLYKEAFETIQDAVKRMTREQMDDWRAFIPDRPSITEATDLIRILRNLLEADPAGDPASPNPHVPEIYTRRRWRPATVPEEATFLPEEILGGDRRLIRTALRGVVPHLQALKEVLSPEAYDRVVGAVQTQKSYLRNARILSQEYSPELAPPPVRFNVGDPVRTPFGRGVVEAHPSYIRRTEPSLTSRDYLEDDTYFGKPAKETQKTELQVRARRVATSGVGWIPRNVLVRLEDGSTRRVAEHLLLPGHEGSLPKPGAMISEHPDYEILTLPMPREARLVESAVPKSRYRVHKREVDKEGPGKVYEPVVDVRHLPTGRRIRMTVGEALAKGILRKEDRYLAQGPTRPHEVVLAKADLLKVWVNPDRTISFEYPRRRLQAQPGDRVILTEGRRKRQVEGIIERIQTAGDEDAIRLEILPVRRSDDWGKNWREFDISEPERLRELFRVMREDKVIPRVVTGEPTLEAHLPVVAGGEIDRIILPARLVPFGRSALFQGREDLNRQHALLSKHLGRDTLRDLYDLVRKHPDKVELAPRTAEEDTPRVSYYARGNDIIEVDELGRVTKGPSDMLGEVYSPKVLERLGYAPWEPKAPVRKLAIVGTAGRTNLDKLNPEFWTRLYASVLERIQPGDRLISGGAPWVDHTAVRAFLDGRVKDLELVLPAPFANGRFQGGRIAQTLNHYHDRFKVATGIDSLKEIDLAIRRGARVSVVKGGFRERNDAIVAGADELLAIGWGRQAPEAGVDVGTLDVWEKGARLPKRTYLSAMDLADIGTPTKVMPMYYSGQFERVLQGQRTATTRSPGSFSVGDMVVITGPRGDTRQVMARIVRVVPLTRELVGDPAFREQWLKTEGAASEREFTSHAIPGRSQYIYEPVAWRPDANSPWIRGLPVAGALLLMADQDTAEAASWSSRLLREQKAPVVQQPTPARQKALLQERLVNRHAWIEDILPRIAEKRGAHEGLRPSQIPSSYFGPMVRGGMAPGHYLEEQLIDALAGVDRRVMEELLPTYMNLLGARRAWSTVEAKLARLENEIAALVERGAPESRIRELRRRHGELYRAWRQKDVAPYGITADEVEAELRRFLDSLPEATREQVADTAGRVFHIVNQTVAAMFRHGLIDKDTYRAWTSDGSYHPIYRIYALYDPSIDKLVEPRRLADPPVVARMKLSVSREDVVKELTGSRSPFVHPVVAVARFIEEATNEIQRNRLAKRNIDYLQHIAPKMQDVLFIRQSWSDEVPPEGLRKVAYMEAGKPKYFLVDQDLADAMEIIDPEVLATGLKTLVNLRLIFHAMAATANPYFAAVQVPKDVLSALLLPEYDRFRARGTAKDLIRIFVPTLVENVVVQYAHAWGLRKSPKPTATGSEWSNFRRSGAAAAPLGAMMLNLRERLFGWRPDAPTATGRHAQRVNRALNLVVERLLQPLETAIKYSTYRTLRARGFDPITAAAETRKYGGSPDFQRYGTATYKAKNLYMFLLPQISGISRSIERLGERPDMILKRISLLAAGLLGAVLWNSQFVDEEGVREIDKYPPDYWRDGIPIIIPGTREQLSTGDVRMKTLKIPLPQEAVAYLEPLLQAIFLYLDPQRFNPVQAILDAIGNFLPGGVRLKAEDILGTGLRRVISGLNPLLRAGIEGFSGREARLDIPIVGTRTEKSISPYEYTARTDPTIKWIAQTLSRIPGAEAYAPVLTSPDRLQHLVRTFLPGLGEVILGAGQLVLPREGQKVESTGEKLVRAPIIGPGIRRFLDVGQVNWQRTRRLQDFYDQYHRAQEIETTARRLGRREHDEVASFQQQYGSERGQFTRLNRVARQLSRIDAAREVAMQLGDREWLRRLHDAEMRLLASVAP